MRNGRSRKSYSIVTLWPTRSGRRSRTRAAAADSIIDNRGFDSTGPFPCLIHFPDTAPAPSSAPERERFIALLQRALAEHSLVKLVLSKPRHAGDGLQRVTVRELELQGAAALSFVYHAQDPRCDEEPAAGRRRRAGPRAAYRRVRSRAPARRGRGGPAADQQARQDHADPQRPRARAPPAAVALAAHDREKRRFVDIDAALAGRSRRHRCAAPADSGDGAQVEADQQVRRGASTTRSPSPACTRAKRSASSTSAAARAT